MKEGKKKRERESYDIRGSKKKIKKGRWGRKRGKSRGRGGKK